MVQAARMPALVMWLLALEKFCAMFAIQQRDVRARDARDQQHHELGSAANALGLRIASVQPLRTAPRSSCAADARQLQGKTDGLKTKDVCPLYSTICVFKTQKWL